MSRIYLASSWRNKEQPTLLAFLRDKGHEVYDFRNPPGGIPNGFNSDFDGMKWADTGVLLLPCGRSAHLELGWMSGSGRRTFIVTCDNEEPELMALYILNLALLATEICVTWDELAERL
jgi:hypothetical protein